MKLPGLQRNPAQGIRYESPRRAGRHRSGPRRRGARRTLVMLLVMALYVISPVSPAHALPTPPWDTNPNDACAPADHPAPEAYGSGMDGMIQPPGYPSDQLKTTPAQKLTYYDRYGTAGQSWYAVDMGCSDAMSLMGNSVANTIFTLVRSIDRTTVTVYQSAASESLLGWLKKTVDGVITGMGKTFNARYWSWVVVLGAMWLAWWGLIRRRASKVAEGTIWMVAAMVGLIWLIARPADFTTLGTKVSSVTSVAFNAALPQSDSKGTTCIPSPNGANPQADPNVDATTRNANGLWVALVCKPWLMGEFGTADTNSKIVKDNADKLLNAQAIDLSETYGAQKPDLGKKSDNYKAVANDIKTNYPGTYAVFQGKQWTSRLAVAFGGLFAALIAGLLVMVISIALIVVKIAFLLLLVAGPVFLGIGIHPGIGRVIAIRWLELLLSMLLKQAALIGVLALLLWAYGLILGEGLPWGLQIMLIALVTFAAFIYRKPFQHLFAAVGYSAVGSREKSDAHLDKSINEVRKNTAAIATAPGAAGYRIARWARRDPLQSGETGGGTDGVGAGAGSGGTATTSDPTGVILGRSRAAATGGGQAAGTGGSRSRGGAPPLNLPSKAGGAGSVARPAAGAGAGVGVGGGLAGSSRGPGGSKATGDGAGSGSRGGTGRPPSWTGGGRGAGAGDGSGSGGTSGGGRSWFGGGSGTGGSGGAGSGGSGSGQAGSGGSGGGVSGDGGATASGRGRGWFGGSDGGSASGGPRSGGSGSGGGQGPAARSGGKAKPADSSDGVPKPRTGNSSGTTPANDRNPPPLWGRSPRDEGPPIPFWLRPVDREDG